MSFCSLILTFGPPCVGKTLHCLSQNDAYQRISVKEIYEAQPSLNMRQVLNQYVVNPILKKDAKIIIDDCHEKATTRNSILNLITKKIFDTKVICKIFKPKYFEDQLLWCREMLIAETLLKVKQNTSNWINIEHLIRNWSSIADQPTEAENYDTVEVTTELTIQTKFKFDVPALFIQWQALYEDTGGIVVVNGVIDALQVWYNCNPCGRILIIHDSNEEKKTTSAEKESQLRFVLKEIVSKFSKCPVYLVFSKQSATTGEYCVPPNPGLVAFMFRLHHLSLQDEITMYWYKTNNHMKMAELAGIKHIKASRVFAHPNLAKNIQATVRPYIPPMLGSISYLSPVSEWKNIFENDPVIPLYNEACTANKPNLYCKDMESSGRKLYMAYNSIEDVRSYQEIYSKHATPENCDIESKIAKLTTNLSSAKSSRSSTSQKPSLSQSLSSESRVLPEWLKPRKTEKKRKKNETASVEGETIEKSPRTELKSVGSHTVYVMNDEELLFTSKMILSQAGHNVPGEEEVQQYLSEHDSLLSQTVNPGKRLFANVENSSDSKDGSNSKVSHTEKKQVSSPVLLEKRAKLREQSPAFRVLDELFGGDDNEESPQKKVPPRKKGHIDNTEPGEEFNAIVASNSPSKSSPNSSSESNKSSIKTVPDSFVEESGSTSKSKPSMSSEDAIPDSFVQDSIGSDKSSKSTSHNSVHSSKQNISDESGKFKIPRDKAKGRNVIIPDSSASNKSSSFSSKSSLKTIPDSLVQDSSSESRLSSRMHSDIDTVADSFVRNTDSSSNSSSHNSHEISPELNHKRTAKVTNKKEFRHFITSTPSSSDKSSMGSSNMSSIKTVPDSFVKNSSSESKISHKSSSSVETVPNSLVSKSSSDSPLRKDFRSGSESGQVIPDSFVPSTITTIPESSGSSTKISSVDSGQNSRQKKSEGENSFVPNPVLDDLI